MSQVAPRDVPRWSVPRQLLPPLPGVRGLAESRAGLSRRKASVGDGAGVAACLQEASTRAQQKAPPDFSGR